MSEKEKDQEKKAEAEKEKESRRDKPATIRIATNSEEDPKRKKRG